MMSRMAGESGVTINVLLTLKEKAERGWEGWLATRGSSEDVGIKTLRMARMAIIISGPSISCSKESAHGGVRN